MVTDEEAKRLWQTLSSGKSLAQSAARANMDEKTARKYRRLGRLPSEVAPERTWRTREDPFAEVWPEVHELLQDAPGLEAKTLFAWLQTKFSGKFDNSQLRSFQRGVKRWRATAGPAKEVFFSQVHHPGRLCASDFTHMKSLAVNNASSEKEFTRRYTGLLDYYGLEMEKIQPEQANENGDVEQSHRRFKEAVEQALLLRGHRDFESREAYGRFLKELVAARNAGRRKRLDEELPRLRRLPDRRRESYKRLSLGVDRGSLIHADQNAYSVPSRLMGEKVEVRLYVEHVEVWYAQREVERFPRLRGRKKHRINYRHIIDWLVRKPGALENYVYREELFPTSRFRMAYDALREAQPERGHKEYLAILYLAARQSETAVDEALRMLLDSDRPVTQAAVEELIQRSETVPAVTDVTVEEVDLLGFDDLLTHKEVWNEFQGGCERKVDGLLAGTALADVSGVF